MHEEPNETPSPDVPNTPMEAVLAVAEPKEDAAPAAVPAPGEIAEGGTGEYGEFDWPDGYVADQKAMDRFIPLARELGLTKEGAQKLARLYAELDQERAREQARFIARNNDEWLGEIRAHPEFGGRNLEGAASGVASMIRRYGSPLLTAQIRQMNIQNWPEMFFFLARLSKASGEDSSPDGVGAAAPSKSTAQLLFPGLK